MGIDLWFLLLRSKQQGEGADLEQKDDPSHVINEGKLRKKCLIIFANLRCNSRSEPNLKWVVTRWGLGFIINEDAWKAEVMVTEGWEHKIESIKCFYSHTKIIYQLFYKRYLCSVCFRIVSRYSVGNWKMRRNSKFDKNQLESYKWNV